MAEEDQKCDFFVKIHDGDVEGVCEFIDNKKEESAPFNNEKGESAAAVALKSKRLKVYEALISRGWWLNSNEKFNEIVNELENVLRKEIREILNEFIKNPDEAHLETLIDNFLDRNRYISFVNADKGKLSLATVIKSRRKKNIDNIIEQFHEALKSELREIHTRNCIKNPNEEHLTALITRTSIYFGGSSATTNRPKYLAIIAGAYEQLNEVPEIEAIFKVVANIKNLNIIFDFDHDSVQHADATGNENVYGKSYAETGRVYLGAKALNQENRSEQLSEDNSETVDSDDDDKPSRSEVLGVLAHELCHVAIFRIYNNNYKPYHKDGSIEEFESVLEHCWDKRFLEKIIALALKGSKDKDIDKDLMYDELCVRVPHLLALYQGDNDKINSLSETFKKLFHYFETKTLPDFEKEIDLMSAVWKLKSKEPQHLTDLKILIKPKTLELDLCANKILNISSNCPRMTMNWIFQEMTGKSNFNFLFLALNHLKNKETFELVVDAHSSCMNPRIVIDCDNEAENEIENIAEEMKSNEITERIILVHDHEELVIEDAITLKFSHSWLDLEEQSKNNLIKKTINFQGEKIVLEEIADLYCNALDFVPLKELLDNYLKIGNEIKFPEIEIYVRRKFRIKKSEEIEPSQLLNIAKTSKLILLSDDPGMGKTTELKMLSMEFKKKLESFWVAFVDLKEYSEFYEKDENFKTNFNSPKEIANFFAKKILKLNEFEERVFKHLFCNERVVLLLDGFDEISPSFKKFVTMLIKSIKTFSRNILISSTRLHLKNELCNELNVEAFTFMPLTEESCFEILEKNFEKKGITEEDLKKKIDQTKEFFEKLNMNSNPAKNPLILQMIAKVFFDNQFVQDMQANHFSIYENFVNIMISESMKKGVDARLEATSCVMSKIDIITFYQKEAFKVLFGQNENKFREYFDLCFTEVQSPPDEQITRIGLMKSDGSGKFQFIHRTFAEYFVADFLFKNVFDLKVLKDRKEKSPKNQAIYEIVREVFFLYQNRYEVVQSFIDGAFENLIVSIDQIEKEVLMSTFDQIFTKEEMPEYFQSFVEMSLLNLTTVITRSADQQDLKRLWTHKWNNYVDRNIFMSVAENGSLYYNKKLSELANEVFDKKDFLNFFTEKNENGETVVSIAYNNKNLEVFDFYLQNDLFQLAIDQFPEDYRIKLNLMKFILRDDISGILNEMEKIEETPQGLESLQKVLHSWTIDRGLTIYNELCGNLLSIEDYEKLWMLLRRILGENNFKILITKPTSHGWSPLMHKSFYQKKEVLISFWELLSKVLTDEEKDLILMEENCYGDNAFGLATCNKDPEIFPVVKDFYLKTLGEEKMKIMLTRERWNGANILLNSVIINHDNVATVKAFWTFVQEIFDVPTLKTILMKTDVSGVLNRKDFNELIKIFEPFIEEHLTALEMEQFKNEGDKGWLRNYFTGKSENGESVVSLIFKSNRSDPSSYDQLSDEELYSIINSSIFKFLLQKDITALRSELEKTKEVALGLKYFQHFLNSWTIDERSIYYKLCRYMPRIEDFEKLWKLLRRILGENDFKILIKKPNNYGFTPLMLKATNKKKEILIFYWKLLSEDLTDEEKEFILMEKDEEGFNAFDYATWNKDPETFLAIKDLYLKTFGEEKMKIMLTRERKNGESILLFSVRYDDRDNVATVKSLWTFIQEIFDISTQKTILMKTNVNGDTFYGKILNRKDFNELMETFKQFIEEHLTALEKEQFKYGGDKGWLQNYFTEKNENGESVVSLIFKSNQSDPSSYDHLSDEELYSIINSSIFKFLLQKDITALRSELEKTKEVALGLKYFQHFLISWTIDGKSIYYELCRFLSTFKNFEKLWKLLRRILGENDFKIFIKKPDIYGWTPLIFKAKNHKKEVFISFWRILSEDLTDEEKDFILREEIVYGYNAFNFATWNVDPETFLAIKDLYLKTFGEEKMRIMLTRERKNGESILLFSVRYDDRDNVATVKSLWTFIQEIFDISTQKTILMKTNVNGDTFYGKILNRKDFNELMETFKQFIEEHLTALEKEQFKYGGDKGWLQNYFTEKNENGESVVSLIFKSNQSDPSSYDHLSDEELYSIINSSIFKFLLQKDITALRSELEKTKEVALGLKYFQHFLISWTIDGKSIYYELCRFLSTFKNFEKLWKLLRRILGENDFKIFIKKPDIYGWTPLIFKAKNHKKEVFISFWRILSEDLTDEEKDFILREEIVYGYNAFNFATWNVDPETFLAIKDLYLKTFGEEKMRIMLTRERKNGESILLFSVRYDDRDNVATVKSLWTFIQEIFDISTQKTILMKTNVNGDTFYGKILNRKDFNELMETFKQFIEEHLTALEKEQFKYGGDKGWLQNYFTEKNENGESVVSLIFKSNQSDPSSYDHLSDEELYSIINSSIFKFLLQKDITALRSELEKTKDVALGLKYFQHFLNSWTIDERSIYFELSRFLSTFKNFENLWKLLRRILGENDFKILIKKPDGHGSAPLMFKAELREKEVFNFFWKLLTENLPNVEKEKLLIEEDKDCDNAFDCATLNIDHKTFLAIKDLYLETFGEEKMKIMLMRERKNEESILLTSVRLERNNVETVKALWTFIQEIFDVSTQKMILMKTNEDGETFYEKILNRKDFKEIMKIFEPFIEEHLTALETDQFKYKSEQSKIIGSYSNQELSKVVELVATSDEKNKNEDIEQIDQADEKRRWLRFFLIPVGTALLKEGKKIIFNDTFNIK